MQAIVRKCPKAHRACSGSSGHARCCIVHVARHVQVAYPSVPSSGRVRRARSGLVRTEQLRSAGRGLLALAGTEAIAGRTIQSRPGGDMSGS
eukprot:1673943-Alexandrium_andersonii.AAC.1